MSTITKDLGAVTAYAYAVEQGYTGTEEEFATLMASYATVAEEAAESAESASTSATSASASAQTATTKASEASQSATQAGTKASQASTSATQASASATSASQSAQTATTKASEASASASTASTKASEASQSATDAQTAQTGAETAQGLAESAKDDAETARDMAQQYAESIDPENIYSAYPTDTTSGGVVSFADGADDIPLKSCVVAIEPVQSGSGDPSPDNVRPISGWTGAQVVRTGKNLLPCVLENGSQNGITWTVATDGSITISGSSSSGAIEKEIGRLTLKSDSYKINGGEFSTNDVRMQLKSASGGSVIASCFNNRDVYFTISKSGTYVVSMVIAPVTISGTTTIKPMIRFASESDSTYTPYTGSTYSITFPSEAGTVYGGELDVTNGVLTVDRAMVDLGALDWSYIADFTYPAFRVYGSNSPTGIKENSAMTCTAYKFVGNFTSWNAITQEGNCVIGGVTSAKGCIIRDDAYTDEATFKASVTGQMLAYELATPVTYNLTPTEIKSLLGDNNVWADAGDTEVIYRADTKLYIDKKIAEVVNAIS